MTNTQSPFPTPTSPFDDLDNSVSSISYVNASDSLPILCKWIDSGNWVVELKNNGRLYSGTNPSPIDRGVTEHIYDKDGLSPYGSENLRLRITDTWNKVANADRTNSPGGESTTQVWKVADSISESLSAEIGLQFGIEGEVLSAELKVKLGIEVTVKEETETDTTFTFKSDPHLYVRTIYWQNSRVIDVVDTNNNIVAWADNSVHAVIKPDYNDGKEYQSYITSPKSYSLPGHTVQQITYFNSSLEPVLDPNN